ncbi:cupin domain-containing protein [Qipengyuania sp.]|uniref:cupin domain-containing protein n=1 Tax=Qipengyuania sp. TaxID=2004515 RepID=UPI0035C8600C
MSLAEKFGTFSECWAPRIVARYEGHEVRIARLEGAFDWHAHDHDELFLVVEGTLTIEMRDRIEILGEGELIVIPAGTEHRPVADAGEVKALLIDPAHSPNTGNTFMLTQPIDDEAATCANGMTIGFKCNSPEQVKELHDVAVANGATSIEGPPGPRDAGALGTMHLSYFRDLDGHKICGIHREA